MTEKEYQEAYEKEKQKSADLAARIAQLEDQKKDLELRLGHIQNNPLWKWSKPARKAMHFCIRQKDRIANCGGPKGVLHKIHYKIRAYSSSYTLLLPRIFLQRLIFLPAQVYLNQFLFLLYVLFLTKMCHNSK